MRPDHRPATRWIVPLVLILASAASLACIALPSSLRLTRLVPTAAPLATLPPAPPTAAPTSTPQGARAPIVTKVTEQEMNERISGEQTRLGQGVDCRDMQMKIRASGITLSATVIMTQLKDTPVPVEIEVRPVVREERVNIDVLDVRLGGPYAALSTMVKPLLATGVAQAFDADSFMARQGLRITHIELQDGYMLITSVPVAP